MPHKAPQSSPRWTLITKLVIALTAIAILGALVVRFHTIIGPILMAFVLAYLLHPPVAFMSLKTRLSWRAAVNIVYLVFVLVLLALLTWGGVGLVGQIQNLIAAIQNYTGELPTFIESLSHRVFIFGPIVFNFSMFDWGTIGQQVLGYIQPALGQIGGLVGTLAGSAAASLGWTAFVVLVSYFFLLESGGLRERIIQFEIPGYAEDQHRLGEELGRIWNAFLRGQMIIFISTVLIYTTVFSILGVHYFIGLAILAGFATFLPYVGPAVTWVTLGLVTYFQGSNMYGLNPLVFTILALALAVGIDQIFNNLVSPRIMAQALRVHPAAVLISAVVAASLLGVLGVILAAPLLATLQLFGRYALRKMFDEDPWPPEESGHAPPPTPKWLLRLSTWWRKLRGEGSVPQQGESPGSQAPPKKQRKGRRQARSITGEGEES
jgi:predicted PurR-regulated permease PerM